MPKLPLLWAKINQSDLEIVYREFFFSSVPNISAQHRITRCFTVTGAEESIAVQPNR